MNNGRTPNGTWGASRLSKCCHPKLLMKIRRIRRILFPSDFLSVGFWFSSTRNPLVFPVFQNSPGEKNASGQHLICKQKDLWNFKSKIQSEIFVSLFICLSLKLWNIRWELRSLQEIVEKIFLQIMEVQQSREIKFNYNRKYIKKSKKTSKGNFGWNFIFLFYSIYLWIGILLVSNTKYLYLNTKR